ncbi:beta-galactosidase [Nakamurella panacisegetis]|uniref:Beta-galactosidase n=2 Tax=Nakamurella panacisegetis TaxID=1090615 RepID=A0A1H0K6P2_9ACTN|nr:beta-galactosidase [Nakamurella panacisegetis]SDO51453.1 beta-galactosidase [Nakamurella panacisegetis]
MTDSSTAAAPRGGRAHFIASMDRLTRRLGGRLAFGADYNPEQWPESVWPQDIELMTEAGVNLVSVGIFSWALLEPKEGLYEFGWLDRIIDRLHAGGIAVDLANASATPPPWFSRQYPQSLLVDVNGVRRSYGGRQSFCPSSPEYRTAAAALTATIADRYADHPAVAMWHVHNEYGCHNWACYCDESAVAFRRWLQARYGELDTLNDAWGTTFWSQRYYDWAEILPPRTPSYNTFANPTQQLDFARFSSEELLDCFRAEAAVIRARAPQPVTTNFMSFFKPLDYFAWAKEQDLISNDHYRIVDGLGPGGATHDLVMSGDLMRSLSDGAPWLLMEHSTSAVNWQPRNPAKVPGQMISDSLTHLARGADGDLFFQWRASKAGAEKFHSAMLPHAGTDSARWREVTQLGAHLKALAPVAGSRVTTKVAIAFDWNAWWGVELDSHPSVDVDMMTQVRRWHRSLWEQGVVCDFVHPDGDLDPYDLVLAPALYLCTDPGAANLAAVTQRGGTVVVGYFSGIVDENDHIRLGGYPGAFAELLGVRIEEFSPLLAGGTVTLLDAGGATSTASIWTESITATDAEVISEFVDGPFPGQPAITRRAAGAGSAWYLGTAPETESLGRLLRTVCEQAGIAVPDRPPGLDVVVRQGPSATYSFVVNRAAQAVPIDIDGGTDLLTGESWPFGRLLEPGAVAVIARTPA